MPSSSVHRVRVVVVNFNGGEFVGKAIERLLETTAAAEFKIVVVDNASIDGSVDGFGARFPQVRLIRSSTNLGFAGGNNLALRDLSGVDAVALVNSDCFVQPDWLDPLIAVLEADPTVGAATPKILFDGQWHPITITSPTFVPGNGDSRTLGVRVYEGPTPVMFASGFSHPERGFRWSDAAKSELFLSVGEVPTLRLAAECRKSITLNGTMAEVTTQPRDLVAPETDAVDVINNVGNELTAKWWGLERGFREADRGQWDQAGDIPGWCGACVLLRTDYLRDVGLMDDRFFLYFEDTDLSLRGAKRGWRYRYVPTSVVRHGHGLSSGSASDLSRYCTERNRLVVIARHAPRALALKLWATATTDALRATRRKESPEARLRWRSLLGASRIILGGKPRSAGSAN